MEILKRLGRPMLTRNTELESKFVFEPFYVL